MADDDTCAVRTWAASGAMALTGRRDGSPLGPPRGLVEQVAALGARFAARTTVGLDPLALLGERAALGGLSRAGDVSCGGATRVLPAVDGWVALSLARPEDVDLVPALVEREAADPWAAVEAHAARTAAATFVDRARMLGLPVAALPAGAGAGRPPVVAHRVADAVALPRSIGGARVVDLSSLWAGPLCGALLAAAGAEVIKVESSRRPDGARSGPAPFFDLLNGAKASVALDLTSADGVGALRRVLESADVVIEGSRPRALRHLGIHAERLVGAGGPQVWVSITGHGRVEPAGGWVAFGDDAAVAGGLVVRDGRGPCFCADAVADPLTGLTAAVATLDALSGGGRWVLDVAMSAVAASMAGPTLTVPAGLLAAAPRTRVADRPAPSLGAHTVAVLGALTP